MDYLLVQAFFGPTQYDREALILEPFFLLKYYAGFTWPEYYNLPVVYKKWFVERLDKEMKEMKEAGQSTNPKGPAFNSPDMRALGGKIPFG